jgi:hypothetical protein
MLIQLGGNKMGDRAAHVELIIRKFADKICESPYKGQAGTDE